MTSLDEITGWTKEELAAGWRFGIWRNATPEAKGDYLRDDSGKILRFERAAPAYAVMRAQGFAYHVGPLHPPADPPPKASKGKKRKKAAPAALSLPLFKAAPSAYVCPVPPDIPW